MLNSAREQVMAAFGAARARPVRTTLIVAAAMVFLLLLGDSAGIAILVTLLVVPAVVLFYLTRLDLYEREPWALMASVVGAGALVGLLGGWLADVIFDRFWFTESRLNLGAVGFSGISANGEGSVPFGVLLLNGILLPILTGAAVLGGPIALRRWTVFRNEITDGMTLGGLAAAGFATVSSFVYFWPGVLDDLADRPVSDWTALLTGIVVVRPLVLILAGSLLGIAAWQYLSSRDIRAVLVTGVAGAFGWLAMPLGSLVLTQSGAVTEFVWYIVVLVVVGLLFRHALGRSLAMDRSVLEPADGERRVVCPNCHRVTPDGSFCSFCRAPLHPETPAALGSAPATGAFDPNSRRADEGDGLPTPSQPTVPEPEWSSPGRASGPAPVMAQAEGGADQSDAVDQPVVTQPAHGDDWWDEPEADGLDYLEPEAPSAAPVATPAPEAAGPRPFSRSSTDPDPSFERSQSTEAGDISLRPDGPRSTDRPAAFASEDGEDEDEGLFPTDESTIPTPPVSLQNWQRRTTVENPDTDDLAQADQPSEDSMTSSSSSLWGRSAPPTTQAPSGLKWPTAPAAPFEPGASAPASDPTGVDTKPADDASEQKANEEMNGPGLAESPVASSSGRWFDASTSTAQGQGSDQGTDEPIILSPVSRPEVGPNGPPDGAADSPESSEASDSPGSRWYRREEDAGAMGVERAGDANGPASTLDSTPAGGPERSFKPDASAVSEPSASSEPGTEGDQSRPPGIWRSLTRQGRSGTPRAPRRDQERDDEQP